MKFGFPIYILSIPFIWHHLPFYKKIFLQQELAKCYIHELSPCFSRDVSILNKSWELPELTCILSNIVEVADFPDQTISIFTHNMKEYSKQVCMSFFENLLKQIIVHTNGDHYNSDTNMKFGFHMHILSIPFIWHHLPFYKKIFIQQGLAKCYIHELSLWFSRDVCILNKSWELPGLACILSNIVEMADFPDQTIIIFTVNALLKDSSLIQQSYNAAPFDEDIEMIGRICCFLHITFNTLPTELIMIGLARGTDIVLAI